MFLAATGDRNLLQANVGIGSLLVNGEVQLGLFPVCCWPVILAVLAEFLLEPIVGLLSISKQAMAWSRLPRLGPPWMFPHLSLLYDGFAQNSGPFVNRPRG